MALEIQQSINQILASSTLGMGLFLHTPAGKKLVRTGELKQNIKNAEEKAELAEKGYQKAGLSPEEAQVKAHDIREQVIKDKKELAELTGDVSNYEDIARDEEMVEVQREELEEKLNKQQEAVQKQAEAKQREQELEDVAKKTVEEAQRSNRLEQREAKVKALKQNQNDAIEKGLEKVERDRKTQEFLNMVMEGTTPSPKAREVIKYGN